MTSPNPWPVAGYGALAGCLEALAHSCPALVPNLPSYVSHQLHVWAEEIQAQARTTHRAPTTDLTLSSALAQAATARGLLAAVGSAGKGKESQRIAQRSLTRIRRRGTYRFLGGQ